MRVLNVADGPDTGGWGARLRKAFGRHQPDVHYESYATRPRYFDYDTDIVDLRNPGTRGQLIAAWNTADVVHLRNSTDLQDRLRVHKRPTIVQYHGARFRNYHHSLLPQLRQHGATGIVSTLDLWLIAPAELTWVPSPYDLDWLTSFWAPRADDGILRIAHAPTDREIKSTEPFLAAVDKLRQQLPVELILIENTPWLDCLALKGTADVYYDQAILGMGNNAIEAMGMGIPVVCGAQDATLAEYYKRFGSLPFVLTDEGSIYQGLLYLAAKANREQYARRGLEYVRAWHDERVVVEQLHGMYEQVAGQEKAA